MGAVKVPAASRLLLPPAEGLWGHPMGATIVQDSTCEAGGAVCSGRSVHARMAEGAEQTSGTSVPLRCPGSTPDLGTRLHADAQGDISTPGWTPVGCCNGGVAVPMSCWLSWHAPLSQATATTAGGEP